MISRETMALIGKIALTALVAGVVGFAVGYFLGSEPVSELEEQLKERTSTYESEAKKSSRAHAREMSVYSERAAAAERRVTVQSAALAVRRAIDSLDARNFGTAQNQIDAAEEMLRQRDDLSESVRELQTALSELRLVAATDFGKQRSELLAIAQGLGTEAAALAPVEP